MLFRKNKIKEKPKKHGLYGNKYNNDRYSSGWDSLGFLEQVSMIILPCLMVFMFNLFLEMMGLTIWWVRLLIAIGIEVLLLSILWYLISWLVDR